jgi:hypothetical protein
MDALNPTANAAKNVARRSGTPGHAATADFVADESNHADVQHIPPGTVVDDPEPTTAAETCMAQPAIISGFPKLNSSHSLREVRERCGTHLDTRQDVSLFCFADMRKKIRLAASDAAT